MKIIPSIDIMDGKVVRLYKGNSEQKTVYSDNPLQIAKNWQDAGADIIHIVDLDATLGLGSNLELIKTIVNNLSIPVEVAGGLRDEIKIRKTLEFASKVVLGTLAFQNQEILKKLLNDFGKNRIIISVDHIEGIIVIDGWKKSTGIELIKGINDFIKMGFTEFFLTNVSKDGTLQGPDLEFLQKVCAINSINVIASGGISNLDDIVKIKKTNAFGAILGKALYEKKISIEEAKKLT